MPKAKKSKAGSSLYKDFDKQKTKLGKGKKAAPTNATNTSFKARSIALTQQSITKDRSAAPTSKRNLTVEELIGQTRHYSASVRRDALTGLKEVYQSHKELIVQHLGLIIPNVSRLMSDDDVGVRKSLATFMASFLARVGDAALQPYASTLLLHTTSAMSHIYPDVRLDGVRILDLLYPSLGRLVALGWQQSLTSSPLTSGERNQEHGERVLRCYLSLLGLPLSADSSIATNPSSFVVSSDLSPGARLLILRSMLTFFQQANEEGNKNQESADLTLVCPTWFFDPHFTSLSELQAFKTSFLSCSKEGESMDVFLRDETCAVMGRLDSVLGRAWTGLQAADAMDSLTGLASSSGASNGRDGGRCRLFQLLSPLLLSVFLDAAPTAFAPSGQQSTASTQLVCVIASLTLALWRGTTMSEAGPRDCLAKLLSHMSAYFPFGEQWQDADGLQSVSLNLAYCELVGLLAMTQGKARKKEEAATALQMNNVSHFVTRILTEEGRQDRVHVSVLRGSTFVDLLPTVWLLLNGKGSRDTSEVIDALLAHWNALRPLEPTKRVATEFLALLWLLPLQRSYRGTFTIRPASPYRPTLVAWLTQSVPRYLWELHAKDAAASALLLELLRTVACHTDGLIISDAELGGLARPLTPFFQVHHATKGVIAGPYTRLPPPVQRIARGLLSALPHTAPGLHLAATAVGAA